MATVVATPTVVNEIMADPHEHEFWAVVREHERPGYYDPAEGVNSRLNKAARVVYEERLVPNSDGSYTVEGTAGHSYRVREHCSCPASTYGKGLKCYHEIAVALYVEWQRRLQPLALPVDDQTLPLPLPPATVEERLAQPHPASSLETPCVLTLPEAGVVRVHPGGQTTPVPPRPVAAPRPAEESPMPEAPDPYIPEPEAAPGAVLARPAAAFAPRREPAPSELEAALSTWTAERAIVQRFLKQELKAGVDFYTLKIGGRESKPSLSKAGAEKVTGWLKLQASFAPDTGTWEMLGRPQDLVCYVCTLRTRSGEIVGEGRGARSIPRDNGDVNKAIKMAEKSSFVSAVLRTGALSDIFTCDLEDMPETQSPPSLRPADLRAQIWARIKVLAPEVAREEVGRWVQERTGYALVERHFPAILHALEVG